MDKYLADERCTFTFTLNAYYSMFTGILRLYDPAFLARMPKDLPVLFLAGDADPVGERSAGVRRAVQSMKDAGMRDVQVKFYPVPGTSFCGDEPGRSFCRHRRFCGTAPSLSGIAVESGWVFGR